MSVLIILFTINILFSPIEKIEPVKEKSRPSGRKYYTFKHWEDSPLRKSLEIRHEISKNKQE
jgi:hypothetical protein